MGINAYFSDAHRPENLVILSDYCAEFLVHGVDVEGKKCGIEVELVILLGESCPLPVTYGKYGTVLYSTLCVVQTVERTMIKFTLQYIPFNFKLSYNYISILFTSFPYCYVYKNTYIHNYVRKCIHM